MPHIRISHVTQLIASSQTHRWVMLHIWMGRVKHLNESMGHIKHLNETCHTSEWVISHIWSRHAKHTNGSTSHIWTGRVTHMNESCHTYEWVMSQCHNNFSLFHFESTMRTPAPIWIPSVRSRRRPASPFQCPRLSMVPKNKTHARTFTQTRLINLSMDCYKKKTVDQLDDIRLCNLCSVYMHVWSYTPPHYNVYLHSQTCCELRHLPGIWRKRGLFECAHHLCSTTRKADSCVQRP